MSKRKNSDKVVPKHGGGPKTDEGKARSSMNRLRHGLTGKTVVLPTEDPIQFEQLLGDYIDLWNPVNPVELDLVHEMTVCRWRLMRIWNAESRIIEITIERKRADVDKELHECPNGFRTALGILSLAEESKSMSLFMRYERQLTRRYDQVIKELEFLQNKRKADDAEAAKSVAKQPEKQNCDSNSPRPILVPKPAEKKPLDDDKPDLKRTS